MAKNKNEDLVPASETAINNEPAMPDVAGEAGASAPPRAAGGKRVKKAKRKLRAKKARLAGVVGRRGKKPAELSAPAKAKKVRKKARRRQHESEVAESPLASEAATKAASQNKTALVEAYLREHPKASRAEIVEALAAQGVVISMGYASGIKFAFKLKQKKARKAARKATAETMEDAPIPATKARSASSPSLDALFAAKQLAESLGGIDAARDAIAALARLTS